MLRKTSMAIAVLSLFATPVYANETQIECLAKAAYFEARGEGTEGMKAVANVVINRSKNKKFPSTPCAVVHQKNQFSWVGKGYSITSKNKYDTAKKIAIDAYSGKLSDNTNGATHFHSSNVRPRWNLKYLLRIGSHLFYR